MVRGSPAGEGPRARTRVSGWARAWATAADRAAPTSGPPPTGKLTPQAIWPDIAGAAVQRERTWCGVRCGQPDGRAPAGSRMWPLPRPATMPHDPCMQVIATRPVRAADRLSVLRMGVSALLLLLAGALVGWLCLGTTLVSAAQPQGRPTGMAIMTGILAWAFAIIVPAGFLLLGAA